MSKKWITPLQKMMAAEDNPIPTVDEVTNKILSEKYNNVMAIDEKKTSPLPFFEKSNTTQKNKNETLLEVNPHKICNWELHDRPESELGNLEELSKDMAENGQAQPCLVRPYLDNPKFDYELIVGERRWRAAKIRNLKLKVIVENISDQKAAIYQIAENGNRKDLSDYAKGINYSNLIEKGIITAKDLEKILGKNKIEISRLLSFNSIPKEIWDTVSDTTKVSSRTAAEIRSIINKGEKYYAAIIELAPKIRTGKLGANSLTREVEKILADKTSDFIESKIEVRTSSGRHLYSWRKDSNGNISISFPKDIRNSIDKKSVELVLTQEIEKQLAHIDKQKMLPKKANTHDGFHVETA